ncbi:MAG: hypothetical protein R3A48_01910 [Polyangiales bacterium]
MTSCASSSRVIGEVIGGIFAFFAALMISAYLLVTEAKIFEFLRNLFPRRRATPSTSTCATSTAGSQAWCEAS